MALVGKSISCVHSYIIKSNQKTVHRVLDECERFSSNEISVNTRERLRG